MQGLLFFRSLRVISWITTVHCCMCYSWLFGCSLQSHVRLLEEFITWHLFQVNIHCVCTLLGVLCISFALCQGKLYTSNEYARTNWSGNHSHDRNVWVLGAKRDITPSYSLLIRVSWWLLYSHKFQCWCRFGNIYPMIIQERNQTTDLA